MASYSIKDLERLSGIKAHTIRIWEKRYGLIEPERTSTNIRTYCDAELKKLLNISILNKNGFKISKIAELSPEDVSININRLSETTTDTQSQIESLAIAMIDLDENKFEKVLSRAIIQLGFEDTVIRLLNPFFVKIGLMWQTGSINPAQEHFVSSLVRQKMLVAIDSQISDNSPNSKSFTLFLPEGEMHEIGLLFSNYLIRKRGHRVLYLGQSLPMEDLIRVEKIKKADYLLTSFTTSCSDETIRNLILQLGELFPETLIYISGNQVLSISDSLPENFKHLETYNELIEELNLISSQ